MTTNRNTEIVIHDNVFGEIGLADKDGGASGVIAVAGAIAAVIEAVTAAVKLFKAIDEAASSGEAAKDVLEKINTIVSEINLIQIKLSRIADILEQLPIQIDRAVRENFQFFLEKRLLGHLIEFREIVETKANDTEFDIVPEANSLLTAFRRDVRHFMGYGLPSFHTVHACMSVENALGKLSSLRASRAKGSLESYELYFFNMRGKEGDLIEAGTVIGSINSSDVILSEIAEILNIAMRDYVNSGKNFHISTTIRKKTTGSRRAGYTVETIEDRHMHRIIGDPERGFELVFYAVVPIVVDTRHYPGETGGPGGDVFFHIENEEDGNLDKNNLAPVASDLISLPPRGGDDPNSLIAYWNSCIRRRSELLALVGNLTVVRDGLTEAIESARQARVEWQA